MSSSRIRRTTAQPRKRKLPLTPASGPSLGSSRHQHQTGGGAQALPPVTLLLGRQINIDQFMRPGGAYVDALGRCGADCGWQHRAGGELDKLRAPEFPADKADEVTPIIVLHLAHSLTPAATLI